ncbi:MAG: imidazole glycerol phosphate synthase subunit HisF [Arcobacter butzleri]|jgi:cyclase|nr:imidazole glycerol phosphate synthase subunit HisF [Arcobacteraceae bacterium]MDY0365230.1 imidazole glycerol phosphate synthase subunit HisF [Arcobacteraceae bacterium]NLO17647.1 imidazole glycerol phosphate synthase subunit HisF [Aliarcobacter butzleri]
MSNYKKIIPCLDVKDGRVVKGINFVGLKDAGDPVEIAKRYDLEGADEITFLDIAATNEHRSTMVELVKNVANNISIPLIVGGGIKSIQDVQNLIDVGCSKVSINSSAVNTPELINQISSKFGSNRLIVAIDVKEIDGVYKVMINGGEKDSGLEAISWAKEVASRGAGEILLTSMDADGTKDGYDLTITKMMSQAVNVPIIASGGAGTMEHIKDAFVAGASAALAASVFHFREIELKELKEYLLSNNIDVRV